MTKLSFEDIKSLTPGEEIYVTDKYDSSQLHKGVVTRVESDCFSMLNTSMEETMITHAGMTDTGTKRLLSNFHIEFFR